MFAWHRMYALTKTLIKELNWIIILGLPGSGVSGIRVPPDCGVKIQPQGKMAQTRWNVSEFTVLCTQFLLTLILLLLSMISILFTSINAVEISGLMMTIKKMWNKIVVDDWMIWPLDTTTKNFPYLTKFSSHNPSIITCFSDAPCLKSCT